MAGRSYNSSGVPDWIRAAAVEEHDLVGDGQCLALVVRDEHRRDAEALDERADPDPGLLAQLGVEVGERLVEEDHRRLVDEGAGDGDALLLAPRELGGIAFAERPEPDAVEGRLHLGPDLRLGRPAQAQAVGDVLEHGTVGPQRVGLEHEAEIPSLRRQVDLGGRVEDRAAVDADRPGEGSSRPAMERSRVVLPEPERPRRQTTEPSSKRASMPFRTSTEP